MKYQALNMKGLTLIEIIVVIAVIVMLFFIILSAFSGFNRNYALDTSAGEVAEIISEARSFTLASKGDSAYGVHFESDQVTLFKGVTYSSSDPDNQITTLSSLVTLSDISISGGVSDIVFERLTGDLDNDGTVTISLVSDSSKTRTITFSKTGIVEVSI